jgi:hypothetical protein
VGSGQRPFDATQIMVIYGRIGVNYPLQNEYGITAWQMIPVGGPYEGPATLTLAAVPHMARLEAILDVVAPVRTCSQPVGYKK